MQKTTDYLRRDAPLPGQYYALISMVEPKHSKIHRNRESYFASSFLAKFLNEYVDAKKYLDKHPESKDDEFICGRTQIDYENVRKLYYEFVDYNYDKLEKEFDDKHNTSQEILVTGFKIRGVYPTAEAASKDIGMFQKNEPAVDIYLVPTGTWVPYCPEGNGGIDTVYSEAKLTEIMKDKTDEIAMKRKEFEERLLNT